MNRLVIADSSCDLKAKDNLEIVPLTILVGDQTFVDDSNLDLDIFVNTLRRHNGETSTACPSVQTWNDQYEKADECFVVTMTSTLSGTYNSARVAAEMCQQDHPDKKIALFDTLSTGPEMVLLIEQIQKWITENLTFEQIKAAGTEYLKRTHLLFTLKSLHNLSANGRVPKIVASAFDLLNMRMIGVASPEGTIKPLFQCRGDRRALSKLIGYMKSEGYDGGKVRISHVLDPSVAENVKTQILSEWKNADILYYSTAGLCSFYAERGGMLVGFESAA
jgi:DegV family protein with EDD domain